MFSLLLRYFLDFLTAYTYYWCTFLHTLLLYITFQATTPLTAVQKDAFLYRSYIAQGNHRIVLQELKNADPMLQPLKSLVEYLSPGANKPAIVADIDARVSYCCEINPLNFRYKKITYYPREGRIRGNTI